MNFQAESRANARVLVANQMMMAVFYNSGFKVTTTREDDAFLLKYDFKDA